MQVAYQSLSNRESHGIRPPRRDARGRRMSAFRATWPAADHSGRSQVDGFSDARNFAYES